MVCVRSSSILGSGLSLRLYKVPGYPSIMSHSNSPLSSATSQSEDPSETKTALPAQLSNLQKNTKYVSPYAPVSKQQAKGSTSAETASASSSKTDSKMNSGKNISSAGKSFWP